MRVFAVIVFLSAPAVAAAAPWQGYVDRSAALMTDRYPFGAGASGNKNYYDGDFADYDGDGLMDRCLVSRFGLLHNQGGGVMVPVSTQDRGLPQDGRPSLNGFTFGPWNGIGEDGAQWADVDGDGDPDNLMGGNGEPFGIQVNREGRFSLRATYGGTSALNIANIDLERDGDVDLAVAHVFCSNTPCGGPIDFTLLVNDGNGNFSDETVARGLPFQAEFIHGVVAGDLDGDGDFDLVLMNGLQEGLTLGFNDGAGFFTTRFQPYGRGPAEIDGFLGSGFEQLPNLGDIDGDGDLDFVRGAPEVSDGTNTITLSLHPVVSHVILVNDGAGNFTDESAVRWDATAHTGGILWGGNSKLSDVDFDGDLDFFAYQKPGPDYLQFYLNDGAGYFTYRPDLSQGLSFTDAGDLGADTDVADIDGDGTYDLWVGVANQNANTLINTYQDPTGLRADEVREFRVDAVQSDRVTLSWQAPPWAAINRHYKVYRSEADRMGRIDRERVKLVAWSVHEDDSFTAPIDRNTTDIGDPDVTVDGRADRVAWTDTTVVPGVRYHYTVSHVGTERSESHPSRELTLDVPPPAPGPDTTPPALTVLHPTSETWSQYPRVVLSYADGQSGVDLSTLSVRFDVPVGSLPAGTNLATALTPQRLDGNSFVLALREGEDLPVAMAVVTLTAEVADNDGNRATVNRRFVVSVGAAEPPTASLVATPRPGSAVVDFDASGSTDPDGEVLRWEWYFGDGQMALGQTVSHRYEAAATWPVLLVVRDNDGGVASATTSVVVGSVTVDSDGDGVDDPADCAPKNPLAKAPAWPVASLKAVRAGADVALSWDDHRPVAGDGTVYDLVTGALADLRTLGPGPAAVCAQGSIEGVSTAESNAPGAVFFQLRARNACGHGDWQAGGYPACP